jgi:lysozyme
MNTWQDYAYPLIKKWEDFRAKPYLCPAGVWTIGYGTTHKPSGSPVKGDDPEIDEATATAYMEVHCERLLAQITALVTVHLTWFELAAMVALTYNIGVGIHDGHTGDFADSSIVRCANAQDYKGAATHFLDWDKAHIKGVLQVVPGLLARRQDEAALFLRIA